MILNFYTHEAIPLSKIVIFTGSLSSFFLNLKLKHPNRNSKALDYNLIILICPNLLFGTILGVTLNKILPNLIIIFLLTILLFYNTYKTTLMGIKQYNEENENENILNTNNNLNKNSSKDQINNNNNFNTINNSNNNLNNYNNNQFDPILDEINKEIEKDNIFLRWDKLKFVIIPFLVMAFLSILRETTALVPKCSFLYWFIFLSFFIFALIINYISYLHVQHEYNYRNSLGFPYDQKDIKWSFSQSISIALIGLISGFIAGTIGIGGGVVLGPILLSYGIFPVVSTVTTNFLVLLTSSSTSLQFILSNMMNYQYAFVSIIFSILGSYVGTKIIHHYFTKSGRQSLLIFALVLVIGSSALILPISSIISTLDDIEKGIDIFRFNSPCYN